MVYLYLLLLGIGLGIWLLYRSPGSGLLGGDLALCLLAGVLVTLNAWGVYQSL